MIAIIDGLPDNVVGIIVTGRLTKKDCDAVLVPAIEKSVIWHYRLRLYYEIRSRYPGAAWEDVNLGLDNAFLWERVALVTDVAAIRHAAKALRLLMPAEMGIFPLSETARGLAWITAADPSGALSGVRRRGPVSLPPMGSVNGKRRAFRPPSQYLYLRHSG